MQTRQGLTLGLLAALLLSVGFAVAGALGHAPAWAAPVTCVVWTLLWTGLGAGFSLFKWWRTAPLMALGQSIEFVGYGVAGLGAGLGNRPLLWVGLVVVALGGPVFVVGLIIARGEAVWRRMFIRRVVDSLVLALAMLVMWWRIFCADDRGVTLPGASFGVGLLMFGVLLAPSALVVADRSMIVHSLRSAVGPFLFTLLPGVMVSQPQLAGVDTPDLLRLICLAAASVTVIAVMWPRAQHTRRQRPEADAEGVQRTIVTGVVLASGLFITLSQLGDRHLSLSLLVLLAVFVVVTMMREVLNGIERERLVRNLNELAHRDALTVLGNRRQLMARLRDLHDNRLPGTVLVVDLDRFKEINDECGHAAGDALLVTTAATLTAVCRDANAGGTEPGASEPGTSRCEAYRLGGDEFVVVVPGPPERATVLAEQVRARILSDARQRPELNRFSVTASIGLARLPDARGMTQPSSRSPEPAAAADPISHAIPYDAGQDDPLVALTRATRALRMAKQNRNALCWFSAEIESRSRRSVQIERRLRSALDATPSESGLAMHYQPVVELVTGRIVALEALARWHDAELGEVSPGEFVPVAEESGLIHRLGRFAVQESTRVIRTWVAPGLDIHVTVNVSPMQLRRNGFAEEVMSCLLHEGVAPERLTIEVTEGIFMDPADRAVVTIQELARAGVRIAIDDFGTGYSSLGYLSRLPANVLKVDRSLIARIGERSTHAVVRAITQLSLDLGVEVIMEGVEEREAADALRSLGATMGQGWLWSAAVPEDRLQAVFEEFGVNRVESIPAPR